jgi:anti-sigma-K factor RskA
LCRRCFLRIVQIATSRQSKPMQQLVDAPTPQALADLVARCDQINRFETQLTAAEEARIAALASGILVMRQVLELPLLSAENLPTRQGRIQHWALTAGHLKEAETSVIRGVRGLFVLDEHEQVKLLSDRTWRGQWRSVTLWKNGEHGVSAAAMLEYLANLTSLAQQRAPDVARALLIRSQAVAATHGVLAVGPRQRGG